MLKIVEINPDIRANVEANNGYCPCAIWNTPDTKCMCKDFREQEEPGECYCGRFAKVDTGRSCDKCANDGMDIPQCKECNPGNNFRWFREG